MNAPDQSLQHPTVPTTQSAQGVRSQGNGVQLHQLTDPRARYIAVMHRYMPRMMDGYPAMFIRADHLPEQIKIPDAPALQQLRPGTVQSLPEIQAACVSLGYDDGFPSLPDGRPIWFRMEHEPQELHTAFERYVELGTMGPRYIASLLDDQELSQLPGLNLNVETLRNAYHMYYWKDRATAHDIFQEAAYRHIRTRRALSSEDKSYLLATRMLERLETIFNSKELWDQIQHDPAVALNYLEKLVKIQRVAAGLPATAPQGEESQAAPTSFEMIMRRVAETVAPGDSPASAPGAQQTSIIDENGRVVLTNSEFVRGALNDPASARHFQELIIRMAQNGGATKQPRWAGKVAERGDGGSGDGDGDGEDLNVNEIPSEFRNLGSAG